MSRNDRSKPDQAMLELFCSEASAHAAALHNTLECLRKNSGDKAAIDAARDALKMLRGSARLVNLESLVELGQVMDQCLAAVTRQQHNLTSKCLDVYDTAVSILTEISATAPNRIIAWLNQQAERIDQVTLALATNLNRQQKSSGPDNTQNESAPAADESNTPGASEDKCEDKGESKAESRTSRKKLPVKKRTTKKRTAEKRAVKKRGTSKTTNTKSGTQTASKTAKKKIVSRKQERSTTGNRKPTPAEPVRDESMLNLFRLETETNALQLSRDLLALEKDPADTSRLEAMMRASHSIKGAARMVDIDCAVRIAHAMEDVFVAAQNNVLKLDNSHIDILLRGVDVLQTIADHDANASDTWSHSNPMFEKLLKALDMILSGESIDQEIAAPPVETPAPEPVPDMTSTHDRESDDRVLRISTRRVNKMMGLSGEMVVNSGWIRTHADSLLIIKRKQAELVSIIDRLRDTIELTESNEQINGLLEETEDKANQCRQLLASRLTEVDDFDRRQASLATRLNHEVLASRMRPFEDGIQGFNRLVRDLARKLDKEVDLQIEGLTTQVDRDILESLEAPLNHLIRNAIDHGIETPEARRLQGKSSRGTIRIHAKHSAGMLSITVNDDGRGVNIRKLRDIVLERQLVNPVMASNLSGVELLKFLFLPGFTTRNEVTEISGRGVGLDVVHNIIQKMRGTVHARTSPGKGLQIEIQLPLTQSVMRCLMVSISGEPYAFPLARVGSMLLIERSQIKVMEDRQYISIDDQLIGLVDAAQVLETGTTSIKSDQLHVIVMGDHQGSYGIVVDDSLGERGLALRALDSRLGKIRNVSASAILDNGTPVLVIDTDDMLRSIENLVSGKQLHKVEQADSQETFETKRILVVDDSLTVREVERKLLESRGYQVDVAVDGMDGWNSVRTVDYDLVVTDIDMPRMNGIEFVEMIKGDPGLKDTPVMIVSYKDRPEDHKRGLEVGADYYLTKGSFHDDSLLEAVIDLIGEAQ